MKILTDEFKHWLKKILICSWLKHQESEWMEEWWALGHGTGNLVKRCLRCNELLDKKSGRVILDE